VPLIATAALGELRDDGELADLVPTALHLLGVAPPALMSGKDLRRDDPGL
jgi:bisphosphoglycerate-independent phosphoglycerate mutase (AlkP superfamily)